MKVSLVVQIPGPMFGRKIPILGPTFTIGRDPQCTLEAADPTIAPVHCALEIRQDHVVLRDRDSPGGTFVNDARIAGETKLQHGDRLKVGPLLFHVSIELGKKKAATPSVPKAKIKAFLVVQVPGPMQGKKIPIPGPAFTIGRDPNCSLEAANPAIAERHCTLAIRDENVFLRDLDSPGGTFVNDARIAGEIQVRHKDRLKVGPLLFDVGIEIDQETKPRLEKQIVKQKAKPPIETNAAYAAEKLLIEYLKGRRR